jgi:hypothetical protein
MVNETVQTKKSNIRWKKCIKWGIYGAWAGLILISFAFLDSYGRSFDLFGIKDSRYFNPISYITYAPAMLLLGSVFWIPAFLVFFGIACFVEYIRSKNKKTGIQEKVQEAPKSKWRIFLWEVLRFIIFSYVMITIYFLVMTFAFGFFDRLF